MAFIPPPVRWKEKPLAELIRRGRAGESWAAIGATFYPERANAAHRSERAFRAYAQEEDRKARRTALVANRFNKPQRRPATPAVEREPAVDPFAGMGRCFA